MTRRRLPLALPFALPFALSLGATSLLSAVAGCSNDTVPIGADDLVGYSLVADVAPEPNDKIDLLFVIDNSGSMAEEQSSLVEWAKASLFDVLDLDMDATPDLHVGVVSTDVGAGGYLVPSCVAAGGGGELRNEPRADCTPPADRYISDSPGPGGERIRNYEGTLGDAFGCIAPLGSDGCGFEQPLASARRALDGSVAENDGFLRDDAILAVVIVSDEDDCSALDDHLFDPNGPTELLGPFTSFRCFEFGVTCAEADPRAPGPRTDCHPRDDSPYVTPVGDYVDFLRSLKPDPGMVVVAGVFGDPATVGVDADFMGYPTLQPSCESANGSAAPAVRLQALLDGFPGRSWYSSICHATMEAPLTGTAHVIAGAATQSPCLLGPLADRTDIEPGLQADCRVLSATDYGTAAERRVEIPACGGGGDGACFSLVSDGQQCGHTDSHLAVSLSGMIDRGAHLLVACKRP